VGLRGRTWWIAVALLTALGAGCGRSVPVDALPDVKETLQAAGKRLSRSHSAHELTELGRDGARLAALLTSQERDALGRGLLRFRVDRPCVVAVAASSNAVPFWLDDQGFRSTGEVLRNEEGDYLVFEKRIDAGTVGLGVNGLDRAPRGHYAVFVLPALGTARVQVEVLRPASCRALAPAEGLSPYVDAYRPFAHLPPRFRSATVLQTANADRYAALFLQGRAWKTHVPSTPLPDQVAIAFGAEPTELVFTWRTSPGVTASFLRVAPVALRRDEPSNPSQVPILPGTSWPVATENLLNDPLVTRHRVVAAGLIPDTRYAYSLGDGSPQGWGPWRAVSTGPRSSRPFRFLYLGDAQTGFEAWGKRLERAHHLVPDAAFLMLAGDLVDRGNERSNWDHFFLRAARVLDRLPLMSAVGNHEYLDRGPYLYRSFFSLPADGPPDLDRNLAYSFSYGDALFVVLDSTRALTDPESARAQAAWLDRTLARSPASWKLVMFHHPLYASHTTSESPELRAAWVPVFDKHKVDLVLQGHDHAYLRTYPMRAGERVHSSEGGTVYVVSVSGDKFYDQAPRPYIARGLTHTSTFQVIDVGPDRLRFRAIDDHDQEVDAFVLEKSNRPDRDERVVRAGQSGK
jgi:acid phosphatase type 7